MPNPGARNYEPYEDSDTGLIGALKDLQETIDDHEATTIVGYRCEAFENVIQGEALYVRASDGKVGKAIANDTFDKALVAGFAQTSKTTGQIVQVIIRGLLATTGLDQGDDYYLSAASAGAITKTPPSSSGQYITRIGESGSSTQLIIKLEPPILLS